jgi:hypothetical protein
MSAPSLSETIGELRDLLHDVQREAVAVGYGVFPGGDTRTFTPDPEASTEAERQAHKDDCARAERGEAALTETRCDLSNPVGQMMRSGYGLGTYVTENPTAQDWAERLERAIGQLEGYAAGDDE